MARHPYLDAEGPIAFAHRGGAEEFPENTLRAFRHAVELGYTHVETDVHATSDGVAVAFHDDALDRVTDGRGVVEELTWSDLQQARVAGTDPIMRLDELLEELPDTRINIDPKSDAAVEPLVDVLKRLGAVERVCVCSFSDRRTQRVRDRIGERLCVGAGPRGIARLLAASARLLAASARLPAPGSLDFHAAQVPVRSKGLTIVRPAVVSAAHRHGIAVHVWTIDEPAEMHRLLDMGVDGIMTDRPAVLRQVMIERGHWKA
ncbi:MAG: glycerophosphodiester phosphodiesterase [Acidimicrobiaceae bacterium]|nr:glycerophosphodiester phosphodiesterase [Acidimicrobiaceae bacterium]MYC91364.1 glycerophosphodiester phosphodiesterase [Gemmatimonadota bacterium]